MPLACWATLRQARATHPLADPLGLLDARLHYLDAGHLQLCRQIARHVHDVGWVDHGSSLQHQPALSCCGRTGRGSVTKHLLHA